MTSEMKYILFVRVRKLLHEGHSQRVILSILSRLSYKKSTIRKYIKAVKAISGASRKKKAA